MAARISAPLLASQTLSRIPISMTPTQSHGIDESRFYQLTADIPLSISHLNGAVVSDRRPTARHYDREGDSKAPFDVPAGGILPIPVTSPKRDRFHLHRNPRKRPNSIPCIITTRLTRAVTLGCHTLYRRLVLLDIPASYLPRVSRVIHDVKLGIPEMRKAVAAGVIDTSADHNGMFSSTEGLVFAMPLDRPPALESCRTSWYNFTGSLIAEWQNQNVIAVLLLSAILTMLQIGEIAQSLALRTLALLSLVCGLMSLLYGSMFMARFAVMHRWYHAMTWAENADEHLSCPWWNASIWVSMPTVWIAWSLIFFIACMLGYIWRAGVEPANISPSSSSMPLLVSRIAITVILLLGLLCFAIIGRAFERYGACLDGEWRERAIRWKQEQLMQDARLGA